MKKNLPRIIMSSLLMVVAIVAASAQCYIVGSDGQWHPNTAAAELTETATTGVYEGEVTFADDEQYFVVTQKLATAPDDWTEFNKNRIGPSVSDAMLLFDEPMAMVKGKDGSFKVPVAGLTYRLRVDFNTMTINLHSDTYVPKYPNHAYLIGTNGSNAANQGAKLTWNDIEGIYFGYVTFCGNKFTISTALASTSDGWDEIKDKRIGAVAPTVDVETNLTVGLKKGEVSDFFIGASADNPLTTYVTLDLVNNRLTLHGNDESYPIGYPKELYTIGCDGNWYFYIPSDVIPATDKPGIYEGEINFKGKVGKIYFNVFKRLGANPHFVDATRLSPYTDEDPANLDCDLPAVTQSEIYYPCSWLFPGEPGTYNIKVDLTRGDGVIRISAKGATGITAPTAAPAAKNYYYDLNGRFLGNVEPQKGVYVVKGKKVIK